LLAQSASSSSVNALAIGATLGSILSVTLIFVLVYAIRKWSIRRKRRSPHNFSTIFDSMEDQDSTSIGPRQPRELKRSRITIVSELGSGHFGVVAKGTLTEAAGYPGYLVAVKSLRENSEEGRQRLLKEAAVMSQFAHERVVGLIGVVTIGAPLLVVIEYCEHGPLSVYLQSFVSMKESERCMLAADCAEGLEYLASLKFVHRDVAARNVLLSSDRRAKLADFGMSRETSSSHYYQSLCGDLPIRWTAPEALDNRKFSHHSDCWSFGILVSHHDSICLNTYVHICETPRCVPRFTSIRVYKNIYHAV
jgi:serine/threonine protein kinase